MRRPCSDRVFCSVLLLAGGAVFAACSADAEVLPPVDPEVPVVVFQRSAALQGGAWEYRLFADGLLQRHPLTGPTAPNAVEETASVPVDEVDRLLALAEVSGLLEWSESDIRRRVAERGRRFPKGTDLPRVRIELNVLTRDPEEGFTAVKRLIEAPWPALLRYRVPGVPEFDALDDLVRTLESAFLAEEALNGAGIGQ